MSTSDKFYTGLAIFYGIFILLLPEPSLFLRLLGVFWGGYAIGKCLRLIYPEK